MKERRMYLRIKKDIDTVLYINGSEYPARVVDISQEGIAFEIDQSIPVSIGDVVRLTLHDSYTLYKNSDVTFIENLDAYVRNISYTEERLIRCGCLIRSDTYSRYVQEQLITHICSARGKKEE